MTGPVDIGLIFEQGDAITSALAKAALAAQREARVLGRPLIVWQDGGVIDLLPNLIPDEPTSERSPQRLD